MHFKSLLFIGILCTCFACSPKYHKYYIPKPEITKSEKISLKIDCSAYLNYIPDAYSSARYVRINVHFMRPTDKSKSFTEAQAIIYIEELLNACNYKLSTNAKMNLPDGNNTPVLNSKIQLVLTGNPDTGEDGIYFHEDDSACWYSKTKKTGVFSLADKTPFKYAIGGDSVLNIFFLDHHPDSVAANPTYVQVISGVSFGNNIKVFGAYHNWSEIFYRDDGSPFKKGASFYGGVVTHEIGHSLGLNHTWNTDDGCDDTPKNAGCWGPTGVPPCEEPTSNNLMDYNGCQCAITPCQLSKMHYRFSDTSSRQRKLLIEDWCDYDPLHRLIIQKNDTVIFKGNREINQTIEIREGGVLIITCKVAMSSGSKIIVKPTGKLILDNGTLTNLCGGEWDGIEVWESKKFNLKGIVEIRNNGKIEHAKNNL